MPLSTNPDDLIPFSLQLDEKLPEAERPTFLLRFLTIKPLLTAQRLYREATDEQTQPDDEKANALMNEVIAIGLRGWRNLPIDYQAEKPGDALDDAEILTVGEKMELARAILRQPQLSEIDRKKFGSRHSVSTESSAPTAQGQSAATNPQQPTSEASPAQNAKGTDAKPAEGRAA